MIVFDEIFLQFLFRLPNIEGGYCLRGSPFSICHVSQIPSIYKRKKDESKIGPIRYPVKELYQK